MYLSNHPSSIYSSLRFDLETFLLTTRLQHLSFIRDRPHPMNSIHSQPKQEGKNKASQCTCFGRLKGHQTINAGI